MAVKLVHELELPEGCPYVPIHQRSLSTEFIQLAVDSLLFIQVGLVERYQRDFGPAEQFHVLNSSEVAAQFSLGH